MNFRTTLKYVSEWIELYSSSNSKLSSVHSRAADLSLSSTSMFVSTRRLPANMWAGLSCTVALCGEIYVFFIFKDEF